ncbi:MAG TPA: nicotinate-nucleotide adenylyltransferase [Pirellulaceae bacterium]|nr:nicotinate-nucleotide adenylyltransferase [Pirellulaceae bacterium]
MRLGIFGGSFDPVHCGHLLLAETCREQCRLDQVWFVPAAMPPHKQARVLAPAKARVEMLELAIAGNEHFAVSTIEVDRGGVSYTVETLRTITAQQPRAALFFPMGADSLHEFVTWREPAEICRLATPVVVHRADSPPPDFAVLDQLVSPKRLAAIREHQVEMPIIDLSSTDLRQRAAEGKSLRYRTPRAVEKYIEAQGLYR